MGYLEWGSYKGGKGGDGAVRCGQWLCNMILHGNKSLHLAHFEYAVWKNEVKC